MWALNRERNPDRILRNADQLYVPPHNYATLKRMPLYNFPYTWNQEGIEKFNPIQHRYLKPVVGKHPDLMVAHPTPTIFPTIGRNFEIS
jgi:hypothetical protein